MRMRAMQVLMVAALGASVLGLHAGEQEKKPRKRFWFRQKKDAEVIVVNTLAFVDQDSDGVVTEVEFFQHVKTHSFRRLDANADNKVSKGEWLAVETGPEAEELFGRWDKNGDGNLTLKEFKDTPNAKVTLCDLFRTLDVDGDRKLTADELDVEDK